MMKKISKLQADGLVKSVYLGNRKKHVYLSEFGIQLTPFDKTYEPVPEELTHDLQVGKIVQEFPSYPNVVEATMNHQISDNHVSPDATMLINKKNKTFVIAIELELRQKSRTRVKSKISRYNVSQDYDYCLFISQKENLLNTYQRFLSEYTENFRKKFFFVQIEEFSGFKPILNEMKWTHKSNIIRHENIIGKKSTSDLCADRYRTSLARREFP